MVRLRANHPSMLLLTSNPAQQNPGFRVERLMELPMDGCRDDQSQCNNQGSSEHRSSGVTLPDFLLEVDLSYCLVEGLEADDQEDDTSSGKQGYRAERLYQGLGIRRNGLRGTYCISGAQSQSTGSHA